MKAIDFLRPSWLANLSVLCLAAMLMPVRASENVPHRPFALWADLPLPGQFIVGAVYEESEAYNFWSGGHNHSARYVSGGESYGIDINQGYLALQSGIAAKWAADLNFGVTAMGWRYFANGQIKDTTGLMDVSLGVRYQIFDETNAPQAWLP